MAEPRPNVLFIVLDQLRADCLTGALADHVNLPNMRALMEDGVTFENHFTTATPCGPARASLLTGQYAMNHRSIRNGTPLDETIPTLPMALRKIGCEPLLFGYTDTSVDPRNRDPEDPDLTSYEGVMPGFSEAVQMRFDSSRAWIMDLIEKGYDLPPEHEGVYRPVRPDGGASDDVMDPALYSAEDSDTAFLTDKTLSHLRIRRDQGWFAHVSYLRPHPPLVAPAPYNRMYDPDVLPPPAGDGVPAHPFHDAFFGEASNNLLHIGFDGRMDRLTGRRAQELRALYLGLTSEVDAHIGRLIAYLKDTGEYDQTLIVVTADHGEMLGDHLMWGKISPHDGALHVPLIIRDPFRRAAAGRRVRAMTESIDIAPTLLDWLGAAPPPSFNGAPLSPFLDGNDPGGWRDHVFSEIDLGEPTGPTRFQRRLNLRLAESGMAIYREAGMKLVHFNGDVPPMLFDLANDPGECRNLADDPAYAAELSRLRGRMLDHRMTFANAALSRMALTADGVVAAPPEA